MKKTLTIIATLLFALSTYAQKVVENNIMSINNMTDETIYSGQDLIIYYYSDELK